MHQIEFSDQELQALVAILANTKDFAWVMTNPLLVKLSRAQQMAQQQQGAMPLDAPQPKPGGNSHERRLSDKS